MNRWAVEAELREMVRKGLATQSTTTAVRARAKRISRVKVRKLELTLFALQLQKRPLVSFAYSPRANRTVRFIIIIWQVWGITVSLVTHNRHRRIILGVV